MPDESVDHTVPPAFEPSLVGEGLDSELLAKVTDLIANLHDRTVGFLDLRAVSPVAKIPAKVAVYRQGLIHRNCDFTRAYVREVNARAFAPAFLLSRAVFEGACVLFDLFLRIQEALKVNDEQALQALDEHLMKLMFGSKSKKWLEYPEPLQAVNVMTAVQRVAKDLGDGVLQMFEDACEFSHPNVAGVLNAYSELDETKGTSTFVAVPAPITPDVTNWHLRTIYLALYLLVKAEDGINSAFPRLVGAYEKDAHDKGHWPSKIPFPRPG